MTDNRALWELVDELVKKWKAECMAFADMPAGIPVPKRLYLWNRIDELAAILKRPVVVGDDSLVVRNPAPNASVPLVGSRQVTLSIGSIGQPDSDWIMNRMREQAYEKGWRAACDWSKRADMIYDIDSPAYNRDREQELESMVRGKS